MSQQTPPSHRFEPHSLGSVHGPPSGFLPQLPTAGIDALGVQTLPVVQSALALAGLQVPRHAPPVPHWKGLQGWVVPFTQLPIPSQRAASVCTAIEQLATLQIVPVDCRWHLPVPSQLPSLPQVAGSAGMHWPAGAGPNGSDKQRPGEVAWLHAMHVPVQTLSQHTPCWQVPLAHSLLTVHDGRRGPSCRRCLRCRRCRASSPRWSCSSPGRRRGAAHVLVAHNRRGAAQVPAPSQRAAAVPVEPPAVHVGSCRSSPSSRISQRALAVAEPIGAACRGEALGCTAPAASVPAGTAVPSPWLPGTAHDMHRPMHAVWQQMPCWQRFELQSSLVVHETPIGRLPQLPLLQTLPPSQSALVVHVRKQALPILLSHT